MDSLADHVAAPRGRGALADSPHAGAAGGAPCGDLIRIAVRVEADRVVEAGFDARGCAVAAAAASAAVERVEGAPLLDAARVGADDLAGDLGGLAPSRRHGAELAADALHRALGAALRDGAPRLATSSARAVVALSGGVDSAVAAYELREHGHEVLAVTLELWSAPETDGERSCCSPQAVLGARDLAHELGLPHFTLDLREAFRAAVVEDFVAGYAGGRTPNPCVRCNGLVRFDALLDAASALGAPALATGHYARIADDGDGLLLRAAADAGKDQSYALARVAPRHLERLRFPLGDLTKGQVRERARAAGLPVADRRESQDLCFAAGAGQRAFLARRVPARAGEVVDRAGRVLGRHDGQHAFTVGQRRGLGVAGGEPLFVLERDAESNRVTVGPRRELRARHVSIAPARLHRPGERVRAVSLRHRSRPVPCRLDAGTPAGEHRRLELELEAGAEAVAPGQEAVLLDGELVVGHGTIEAAA